MSWVLNVRTYELGREGKWNHVLTHQFFGATQQEATRLFESHMKTDAFLRGCTTQGKWDGVTCYSDAYWEQK